MKLSRDKFITIAKLSNVPVLMVHELCHYTVARAVGFQAELGLAHVSIKSGNPHSWKMRLVALAPALAGLMGLIFLIALCIMRERLLAIWPALFMAICWWLMCLDDFYCVWYYTKHKKWPKSLKNRPKPGLDGIIMLTEWRP